MPAIITHDTFGQEVYGKLFELIGGSRNEAEAFLLGNQGPDPLFYSVASPLLAPVHRLGSIMHSEQPTALLSALRDTIVAADEDARPVARAYALGFLCHYLLDSNAHPLVYAQQYALCDAGEPGLTRADGHEVHALIESELDEVALFTRRGKTIASFNPARDILHASERVLKITSVQYEAIASKAYGIAVPADAFGRSVKLFRLVQGLFYSPSGFKHNVLGRVEMLVRPYSFYRAMSHRNVELSQSQFDNHEHARWTNPFTKEESTESFWDIFERAEQKAYAAIIAFDAPSFDEEAARKITHDLNFSGEPTNAEIVKVEEA